MPCTAISRHSRSVISFATVATMVTFAAKPAPCQRLLPSDSTIRALLQDAVDSQGVAGIIVGVTDATGHHFFTAGSAAPANAVPLDSTTIFEIGSITKVFTGALLADMVARGEVALSDPVAKYLPASVHVPSFNGQQITLLDLATQSSGLPRLPTNLSPSDPGDPYADYTPAQLYAFLSSYTLTRAPGAKYEYSNLGVGLLGDALALRAGKSYEALLTERILAPLGLEDTRITRTPAQQKRAALGHGEDGKPTEHWHLPTLAGAGALSSTAADLLSFLDANLDTGSAPLTVVLRNARAVARKGASDEPDLGLAWHHMRAGSDDIVWHNGGTGGFRSFAAIDSVAHRGIVVLANTATDLVDDIASHLIDEQAWKKEHAAAQAAPHGDVPTATLDTYVGEYQLAPTFSIVITRVGNVLVARATNQQPFKLVAESTTLFSIPEVNAKVEFVSQGGRVTGLVLHQNGRDLPGTKIH